MSVTTYPLQSPRLLQVTHKVREAYLADFLGLRGSEDAYFATAEDTIAKLIPNQAHAVAFVDELVVAGIGLTVPNSHDATEVLHSLDWVIQQRDTAGSNFKPLDLLGLVRQIIGLHVWEVLKSEIEPLRIQNGEAE